MDTLWMVTVIVVGWIVAIGVALLVAKRQSQRAVAKMQEASRILEDGHKE